jgi:hypothetical protein
MTFPERFEVSRFALLLKSTARHCRSMRKNGREGEKTHRTTSSSSAEYSLILGIVLSCSVLRQLEWARRDLLELETERN